MRSLVRDLVGLRRAGALAVERGRLVCRSPSQVEGRQACLGRNPGSRGPIVATTGPVARRAAVAVGARRLTRGHRRTQTGHSVAREPDHRASRRAVGIARGSRAGPRAAARLSRQPVADRDRDTALLSPGRLVDLGQSSRGARELLRRSGNCRHAGSGDLSSGLGRRRRGARLDAGARRVGRRARAAFAANLGRGRFAKCPSGTLAHGCDHPLVVRCVAGFLGRRYPHCAGPGKDGGNHPRQVNAKQETRRVQARCLRNSCSETSPSHRQSRVPNQGIDANPCGRRIRAARASGRGACLGLDPGGGLQTAHSKVHVR